MTEPGDAVPQRELALVAWHIGTRSGDAGGQCVEAGALADGSGRVAVRHTRHREGDAFVYDRDEWDAFITAAKIRTFDF